MSGTSAIRLLPLTPLDPLKRYLVVVTDEVKDKLATEGYKRAYGARPMKRAIQKLVEEPLSEELINGEIKDGDKVEAYLEFDPEFPKEKVYSEKEEVTQEEKEADARQALIKAKVKFKVIGHYSEEEQEELKKSTIKKKAKTLGLPNTSEGGASTPPKDPVTGTA